jgi:Domain of unknown function (DUF4262)
MSCAFEWPRPEGEADEAVFRNIRKHGCHIVGISGDEQGPGYAFSIGLFANYGHAEIVIFGLRPDIAATIINDVRDHVAAGHTFVDGDISDDILDGYKVCFWNVPLEAYGSYLGTAVWFYAKSPRPFPCLQLIWPDRNGRFPWEAGCLPEVKADQPLLKAFS